jgi:alpha-glucosidase
MNYTPEGFYFDLLESDSSVVKIDAAKILFEEGVFGSRIILEGVAYSSTDLSWNPVYGERKSVRNFYNGAEITLIDEESGETLGLECRLYDEGFAFRYQFNESASGNTLVKEELTSFDFDRDYKAWVSSHAQGLYSYRHLSSIEDNCERPLLIHRNDSSYLAIGEAGLVDYARMKFSLNQQKVNSLKLELGSEVDLKKANYQSPWRYVMFGNNPGELIENNYFIQNLNAPNKIEDSSWIKPGKVIREVSLSTQGGKACVDFAARHKMQYVEFDAGWYGNEYDDASDATTVTVDPRRSPGPLDLHEVIDYAEKKGIGIILYVNRRALEKQLDEILPLYKSWGIKGLKYGFVNVGSQEWTSWLHEAVRKAADYHLMVDIHDEYRPTGYSRTFPNLMTQEGIRGDEESPTTAHTLVTAFTRMIAGAGDNTNCFMAERVSEIMGGKAGQMAKAVILYSPWQFLYWYDRPTGSPAGKGGAGSAEGFIIENEELEFYDLLPTTWDETLVLEGKVGEYATFARRKGDKWFIGSLAATEGRQVDLALTFLEEDLEYDATIFYQDESGLQNNVVSQESISMNSNSTLSRQVIGDSGFAVIISRKK